MRSAVFLDRDGVINVDRRYVVRREEFEFTDGVFDALRWLLAAGHLMVIVTNQSAIGRGYCSAAAFDELSRWMFRQMASRGVGVTAQYHCPHRPDAGCTCRKPAPGMLLQAAAEHQIDLPRSWLIGDKETDIEAAGRAGLRQTILIRAGRDHIQPVVTRASLVCESLPDAARQITASVDPPEPLPDHAAPPASVTARPMPPAWTQTTARLGMRSPRRDIA